jgi:hypothetical protein
VNWCLNDHHKNQVLKNQSLYHQHDGLSITRPMEGISPGPSWPNYYSLCNALAFQFSIFKFKNSKKKNLWTGNKRFEKTMWQNRAIGNNHSKVLYFTDFIKLTVLLIPPTQLLFYTMLAHIFRNVYSKNHHWVSLRISYAIKTYINLILTFRIKIWIISTCHVTE